MPASCGAITAARLASIASSQSAMKLSGSSATPSRDSNSYTTIFRTPRTSDWSRCYELTDQAAETHRCDAQDVWYETRVWRRWSSAAWVDAGVPPTRLVDDDGGLPAPAPRWSPPQCRVNRVSDDEQREQ